MAELVQGDDLVELIALMWPVKVVRDPKEHYESYK